jgi:menaquinone-dependent protoporphyrinogen IX oxidase
MLEDYEFVVVGGSIYMGKMKIAEWLTNHWEFLKHKKVYFFSVGDMQASETEKVKSVWSLNFSSEILAAIKCKHLSGRSCFRELSWVDKLLVFVAAMRVKDKKIREKMLSESDHLSKESALSYVAEIKSAIETASTV